MANDCRLLSNPLWNRLSLGDLPWIVNSNLTIGWAIIFPTRSMSPTASWRLVPIVPQVRSNGLSFPFAFMIYFLKMSSLGEKIYQLHQKHQYLVVVQALAMGWDWPECLAQSMHTIQAISSSVWTEAHPVELHLQRARVMYSKRWGPNAKFSTQAPHTLGSTLLPTLGITQSQSRQSTFRKDKKKLGIKEPTPKLTSKARQVSQKGS